MKYVCPHCDSINEVDHRPSAGTKVTCSNCQKRFNLLSSRLAREADLEAAADQPAPPGTRYRVVSAGTPADLANAVNSALAKGFQPTGGVAVHEEEYLQAVYHPGK